MTTEIDSIDHIAIQVKDIATAISWYQSHLKCEVVYQDSTWGLLKFANIKLALVIPAQHPPHIAIPCATPEQYGDPRLHRDGTRSVYLADLDGNQLEFIDLNPQR